MMTAANEQHVSPLAALAVDGVDLLDEDTAVSFEVDGLIEGGDTVLLTGQEKVALKTMQLLDLGIARVLGAHWLGRSVNAHDGKVLVISAETGKRQIARRLKALCMGRGIDPRAVLPHFRFIFEPVSLIPRSERHRAASRADLAMRTAAVRAVDERRRAQLAQGAAVVAQREVQHLGRNLDVLDEIEDSDEGDYSLIVFDTVRACLEGDENSSNDARRYMQAARELVRQLGAGCFGVHAHHTNKSGSGADARSSRGSVELTAAPDAILSIDVSGEHPTMHPTLRNHEAPAPFGFRLVSVGEEALRFEVVEPAELATPSKATRTKGIDAADVLAVLRSDGGALTLDNIRRKLADERGGAPGSKANAAATKRAVADLLARGSATKVPIRTAKGTFEGFRAGVDATPDVGRRVNHDPHDVFGVGGAEDV